MRVIGESGVSAKAYTLLGTIHLAEGHSDDAAQAFRRALYLDPDNAEAISHMIVISDRKGNATQAAAFRGRLARQLREDAK
jgi:chemotaxis protein methyltransferase WspC